ncbi:MAG: pitrilysin family protein [Planctomycetota bacterium]
MTKPIKTLTLPGGMVLLGEPDKSFQSAAFQFVIPAGCVHDPLDRSGLGSLTCEMMLRGAGGRDSRALVNDLENLGIDRNESVSLSQAVFGGCGVASNLMPALSIYADILLRPHLPADQLGAGQAVCLQELQGLEDEVSQKLMIELRRQHYPAPWGRSSLGDAEAIDSASIADVQAFHKACYRPGGAILSVAGNFDWGQLCDVANELFGDWAPGTGPPEPAVEAIEPRRHLPSDTNQCHIGIAFDSAPYRHDDYFQAWAAVGVLSGGMSSRLFTEVREKRGLCYTVSASLQTQLDRAAVIAYAGTTAERAQETLDVTHAELLRLGEGVTQTELDRLKARIKSGLIMQQESTGSRSAALARDWRHLGRVRTVDELAAIVDAITADSINAYLEANPPTGFTFLTLGPKPLELPVPAGTPDTAERTDGGDARGV